MSSSSLDSVRADSLSFGYCPDELIFNGISFELPAGSRTLLIGANGAGKSTLLRLLAGRHMIPRESLRVFGRNPFYDLSATREITLIDGEFPIDVDISVQELLDYRGAAVDYSPESDRELIEMLEVRPSWRMSRVSEGQRRRVQLLMALRKPARLLLLDEVTANLDIVSRAKFLSWLRLRNAQTGVTLVYATHILDGLWNQDASAGPWPTHVLFLSYQRPPVFRAIKDIRELYESPRPSPLLALCEDWIRNH